MPCYHIFIIGPIAAGKSTIRDLLVSHLNKIGNKVFCFDINDVLREIYPPDKMEENIFEYDSQSALILKNPDEQIPLAIQYLAERSQRIANKQSFIIEFGVTDFDSSFKFFKADILKEAYVIHVSAQFSIRAERNAKRGCYKVPEYRLNYYPESLEPLLKSALKKCGVIVYELNNTGNLTYIRKSAKRLMKKIFQEN